MKLAVIGLMFLGLVAAASAAFLVGTLRISPDAMQRTGPNGPADVDVLVAVGAAPAMSVVDSKQVTTKKMPRNQAPPGFISSPVEVVGKVLAIPMVEGQAFTSICFAQGAGSQLAAALPKGKRAVGISVTDYAGLDGLLYPGSVVDVMFSVKPDSMTMMRPSKRVPMTMTLLQGVEVLAIERQTVVSSDKPVADTDGAIRTSNTRKVTLLVDPRQAKVLQLAMDQGTLSLALRNPLDGTNGETEHVSLADITGAQAEPDPAQEEPSPFQKALLGILTAMKEKAQAAAAAPPTPPPATQPAQPAPPTWQVTVMRGDSVEIHAFSLPAAPSASKPQTAQTENVTVPSGG